MKADADKQLETPRYRQLPRDRFGSMEAWMAWQSQEKRFHENQRKTRKKTAEQET